MRRHFPRAQRAAACCSRCGRWRLVQTVAMHFFRCGPAGRCGHGLWSSVAGESTGWTGRWAQPGSGAGPRREHRGESSAAPAVATRTVGLRIQEAMQWGSLRRQRQEDKGGGREKNTRAGSAWNPPIAGPMPDAQKHGPCKKSCMMRARLFPAVCRIVEPLQHNAAR